MTEISIWLLAILIFFSFIGLVALVAVLLAYKDGGN